MNFREFPSPEGMSVSENFDRIGQGTVDAVGRFIEYNGMFRVGKRAEQFETLTFLCRWKTDKEKRGQLNATGGESGGKRGSTGKWNNLAAVFESITDNNGFGI